MGVARRSPATQATTLRPVRNERASGSAARPDCDALTHAMALHSTCCMQTDTPQLHALHRCCNCSGQPGVAMSDSALPPAAAAAVAVATAQLLADSNPAAAAPIMHMAYR